MAKQFKGNTKGKGKGSGQQGTGTELKTVTSKLKIIPKEKKDEEKIKKKKKKKEGKSGYVSTGKNSKATYPNTVTAFKVLLSARFCAAMWVHITDCDETFNYWEPSHFLLYGKGFQTWEYSPEYALRSYTYLLLHVVPAWICANIFHPNRMLIFYFLRCLLGLFCIFCECYFYKCVCKTFGVQVGRLVLIFLVFSPGMFISSTAFLPSSFSMYMCFLSTAAWLVKKQELSIFAVALSTYISWPFSVIIGFPIATDMLLVRKQYKKFFQWSIIFTLIIMVPLIKMDSDLYGRFVVPPLNIVLYNIFGENGGPNLYGTEPICFYFINGFLNFNVAFVAAIIAPSFILLRNFMVSKARRKGEHFSLWLVLTPFYIWFVVFTLQPHKEERFLFPVYPLICLSGAICIHSIQIIYSISLNQVFGKSAHKLPNAQMITLGVGVVAAVLGLSRILALYKGYHAPLDVYMELNKYQTDGRVSPNTLVNVCVGKEWHRFPTSFFLPGDNWNLKFIRSEFRGQLPAEYDKGPNATTIVHTHFNDRNREEPSRYFNMDNCHFLIDCDFGKESKLEPNYGKQKDKWTQLLSVPFLNAEKSSIFYRAFYIPFLSSSHCTYANYTLFKSNKFKFYEGKYE